MRKLSITAIGASALMFAAVAGSPAYAQLAVYDGANFANTLRSALTDVNELNQTIIGTEQEILQTEQMVKNAMGLANLSNLISSLGLNPLMVTADQLRMILNGAYAIDANTTNFTQQIRQQLSTQFTVPLQTSQISSLANSTYSSAGAQQMLSQYATKIRDFNQALQYQNVLNNAQTQAADIHQQVQKILASAQNLGDSTETQSLHALTAHAGAQLRQGDLNLQYQAVMADKQTQDELRRLETEVTFLERSMTATQTTTSMRQATFNDATPNPMQ
jgi:hypothetical protein